jgi:hypothetical protein
MLKGVRTVYMSVTYYYLMVEKEPSPTLVKFTDMSFNIIKILSILAIILVVGMVMHLDTKLILLCMPYIAIESMTLYKYFINCSGCCH